MNTDLKLSKREHDIAKLVCKGYTNKEIGKILFISIHTVKANLEHIFEKLKVANRVQLAIKYTYETEFRYK